MGNIQTVGPNEALVISGGCCRPSRREIIVSGWCWNTWMLTNIQRLSLQVMTLNPKCERVQSRQGVPVTVTGVVHCKIMSAPEFLPLAAEQFLGKSVDHIKSVVLQTVEGHMRAVIGTQIIEDICKKRQELAMMIRESTTKDLSRMGIDIMSLTIKDIKDDVEYLSSAGKRTAATVKRDAAVEAAKAEREASSVEATCAREKEEMELQNSSKLATQKHEMEMAKASYNETVGELKAEATKVYDLQIASLQKAIRSIEMEVKSVEFDGLIEIQKKENERRKTELEMEIDLPTSVEIYKIDKQADAEVARLKAETEAEQYRILVEGRAQAEATKLMGQAQADGIKLLAEARKEFNEAAILSEMIDILPKVAAELASPLTRFDEIVLLSDGKEKKNDSDKSPKSISSLAVEAVKFSHSIPLSVKALGGSDQTSSSLVNTMLNLPQKAGT
jgi:flotillin